MLIETERYGVLTVDFLDNIKCNMNADTIRNILKVLGEKDIPTRKAELAARLNSVWDKEPQRLIDLLSEAERYLLAESLDSGSYDLNIQQLKAKYGYSYKIPYPNSYKSSPDVIHCFIQYERGYGYEILTDIQEKLQGLLPSPGKVEVDSTETLPETARWSFPRRYGDRSTIEREMRIYESELAAPAECRRMLQLTASGAMSVSASTGNPTAATQRKVADSLCLPDLDVAIPESENQPWSPDDADPGAVRAYAWPLLLQQCGWAKAKGSKLQLTKAGREILDDFTFERYAAGVTTLIDKSDMDELLRVKIIKGQRGRRGSVGRRPPYYRRAAIATCLGSLPVGRWVSFEEANRVLYALGLNGTAYDEACYIYVGEAQYGGLNGHEIEIGRIYFRQLLGDALATLGVVDLGYSWPHYLMPELYDVWGSDDYCFATAYDGINHIRLTPLGRYCLGFEQSYTPPEMESRSLFKVLPNMDIVINDPASFSPAEQSMIERVAVRSSDMVWRIAAKPLLAALEAGDSLDDILLILQNNSDNDLPQNVLQFLHDTANRAAAVKGCRAAVAVDFYDESQALLVEHDTAASKCVIARVGASLIVLNSKIKSFQTALRKMGIVYKQ